jgi:hypothetical protein
MMNIRRCVLRSSGARGANRWPDRRDERAGALTEGYNICRRPDTIDVEKDRLGDGPFFVRQFNASSDDSETLLLYTAHRSRRTAGGSEQETEGGAMELHPYVYYMLAQERMADAMRDAEQRRLIKSLREHSSSPGWLQRLRLRLRPPAPTSREARADEPRGGSRQAVSRPTY